MTVAGRRRCAVLGSPVAHSLSPVLHRAAYAQLGLDWTYDAIDVTEADLATFLDGLDESWRGLSVTMPLKQAAASLATQRSALVTTIGAANTLLLDRDARSAENTDVSGMRSALTEAGVGSVSRASVLGSGSTALAALAALATITDEVVLLARSRARAARALDVAAALGLRVDVTPWEEADAALAAPVVVSTTPAGATDRLTARLPARPQVLFDVVYDPWPTALAASWRDRGGQVLSGLDLLVWQAVDQVRLMTGESVPVDVLRTAVSRR